MAAVFAAIHVALDLFLRLNEGSYSGLPGTRLLEIFAIWAPTLFLAALLGPGLRPRLTQPLRLALLVGYAALLVALATFTHLEVQGAGALFDLFFRYALVPAAVFLFAGGGRRWSLSKCIGVTLMFFALWRALYFSFPDLLVIASGGATLGPTPAERFYESFFLKTLWDVFYPVLGLLFFFHRVPGLHVRPHLGNELERVLRPFNAWVRRSPTIDAAWGLVLFPLNLLAALLFASLLAGAPTENVGDDSRVFELIRLDQVFLLAIVAGVGEELVFRGLLQTGLERILPAFRLKIVPTLIGAGSAVGAPLVAALTVSLLGLGGVPGDFPITFLIAALIGLILLLPAMANGPATAAIVIQAIAFAIVHAGYADLNHIIQPFLFGLFTGLVFRHLGLIPVIIVHVAIDVLAFGANYAKPYTQPDGTLAYERPEMAIFLSFLVLASLIIGIVFLVFAILRWWDRRRGALGVIARS